MKTGTTLTTNTDQSTKFYVKSTASNSGGEIVTEPTDSEMNESTETIDFIQSTEDILSEETM